MNLVFVESRTEGRKGQKLGHLEQYHYFGTKACDRAIEQAIAQVSFFKEKLTNTDIGQYLLNLVPHRTIKFQSPNAEKQLRLGAETLNLIDASYLILKSLKGRKESRGGHDRRDYPQTSEDWQVHTLIQDRNIWRSPPLTSSFVDNVA